MAADRARPRLLLGCADGVGGAFGRLDVPALMLYAGSIAWVIGYDTIYAHQDREDDALIGIKSTARLFGPRTRPMLMMFYTAAIVLIGIAGALAGAGVPFWLGLVVFAAHLAWQIARLDIGDPAAVPGTVQVEPGRRPDPVRRHGSRCRARHLNAPWLLRSWTLSSFLRVI